MSELHLIDGTYELFRQYFGAPSRQDDEGREIGAVAGLVTSLLAFLKRDDVTHVACAFDHVIPSFRNDLFDGYKTGEDVEPELLAQFDVAEEGARALGVVVWPMVEFEADDALATAAHRYARRFDRVLLATPDKDLAQCVRGEAIVQWDRFKDVVRDEAGVREKFGVSPSSIPDYLALVGDAADGIPGIPAWGAKSSALVLDTYGTIEAIPDDANAWTVTVRGAKRLAANLVAHREDARLYRRLALLRTDVPLAEGKRDLAWAGVDRPAWEAFCDRLGLTRLRARPRRWR